MNYITLQKITIKLYITFIFNHNNLFILSYNHSKTLKRDKLFLNNLFHYGFFSLKLNNVSKKQLEILGFPSNLLKGNITIFYYFSPTSHDPKDVISFLQNHCFPFIYIQERRFLYLNERSFTDLSNKKELICFLKDVNSNFLKLNAYYLYSIPYQMNKFLYKFIILFLLIKNKKFNET